jgi:hypothetical protein
MATPTASGEDLLIFTNGQVTTKKLFVKKIIFISGASGAAGDTCTLTDSNSKVRAVLSVDAAKGMAQTEFSYEEGITAGLYCNGLTVALTHGTAYVYI